MRRPLLTAIIAVAGLCSVLTAPGTPAAMAAASTMRITSLTASPHRVIRQGVVTFRVQVSGLTLDLSHMGQKPIAGHGHLQYYLDKIPTDAYKQKDLKHSFIAAVPTPLFTFNLKASRVKIGAGKHHIIVALARNNDVLYHAPVASVTITVR